VTYADKIKKYRLQIITLILYLATLAFSKEILINSLKTTVGYLKEMVQILPAVFVISGLITVWVPREVITKNFGKESGIKGRLLSILIGSVSAGPIYAAFPVTFSLLSKGASISNMVIIISAWAVVKVPMLIVETKFLGFDFMALRTLLTVPAILVIGYITGKLVKREHVIKEGESDLSREKVIIEIENLLPHYDCGGCGYRNCRIYAENIIDGKAGIDRCRIADEKTQNKIKEKLEKARIKHLQGHQGL